MWSLYGRFYCASENPSKILNVDISLSVLKLMYLSEYVADLSKFGIEI